jgi:hypothetical protein
MAIATVRLATREPEAFGKREMSRAEYEQKRKALEQQYAEALEGMRTSWTAHDVCTHPVGALYMLTFKLGSVDTKVDANDPESLVRWTHEHQ